MIIKEMQSQFLMAWIELWFDMADWNITMMESMSVLRREMRR